MFGRQVTRLVVGLVAGALAVGLGGCAPAPDRPAEPTPTSATSATSGGFPVTIEHRFGQAVIERAPQRVVVVGVSADDLDAVLGLGVVPVGFVTKDSGTPDGHFPWLADRFDLSGMRVINATSGLDVEQVALLEPDLILATGDHGLDEEYAHLAELATTIGYETEWGAQTWQQHVRVVGAALGRPTQAEQLIADTERRITEVRDAYPGLAGRTFTASVGNTPNQLFTLVSPDDFAVKLIEQLGLRLSPSVADAARVAGSPTGSLSPEQYDKLDADLVIIAFTTPELRRAVESNPLVSGLAAVREGRYLVVDAQTISQLRYPSVLGIPWALDRLRPGLAAVGGA
ncbi:iron-siderophore ABC transporter substrate-binding protein [Goodfellowiella coeruleoviolacea]|uniref:Iron complex transport system substrate-binding protein n=1 Tax=Goodfellowiella coeruleoviolacea TaxID=334858 RepID=A0AAE3KGQ7_9PSEU|nr:iron-siderophore ABC transporter substrate-binding protein [Goodfellowiella coeruleoviolacea]MCP2166460.1 iron complex transport system substrate-binding protein [Goodfellowiella coeruleoviolacea]